MLPKRQRVDELLASREFPRLAQIRIFDWGRSELNTREEHVGRSDVCQKMRLTYWNSWLRGAVRILYDSVVLYRRQFSSRLKSRRSIVVVEVFDYDVLLSNELIGCASLPLGPTGGRQSLRLLRGGRHGEIALKAEVEVSIENIELPETSRLSQAWRVVVHSVKNLPNMDIFSKTDPTVVVKVVTPGSDCIPKASTPVVWNDQSAVFNWPLEFGEAREDVLEKLFEELSTAFGEPMDMSMFPTTVVGHNHVSQRWFEAFLDRLTKLQHLSRGAGEQQDRRLLRWSSTNLKSTIWSH